MLEPGRSLPSVLSACTHTSTVVLGGVERGADLRDLARHRHAVRVQSDSASSPTFSSAASAGDTCVRAITRESVHHRDDRRAARRRFAGDRTGRSVTTPSIGLVSRE